MAWRKTAADRQRDAEVYGDPVYRRNRQAALRRAGGRCECQGQCGSHAGPCGRRDRRLETDHVVPVTAGGTHAVANLQVLCAGPGSCHAAKTAAEGGGYRRPVRRDPEPRRRTQW